MSTTTVHLRWDGDKLTQKALLGRANEAMQKVKAALKVRTQLGVQAHVDEKQQYVQLVIQGDCSAQAADRMGKMLQKEFHGKKWYKFWS